MTLDPRQMAATAASPDSAVRLAGRIAELERQMRDAKLRRSEFVYAKQVGEANLDGPVDVGIGPGLVAVTLNISGDPLSRLIEAFCYVEMRLTARAAGAQCGASLAGQDMISGIVDPTLVHTITDGLFYGHAPDGGRDASSGIAYGHAVLWQPTVAGIYNVGFASTFAANQNVCRMRNAQIWARVL